jgi:chromosomal replication initiation ATPase DnaA
MTANASCDAQLPLPLPVRSARGRDDFFVSPSNAIALALLDTWPNWPARRLALVGPEGAGKSHLAAIWASDADARVVQATTLREADVPDLAQGNVVVEGADAPLTAAQERALFHLHNLLGAEGGGLLVTGRTAPRYWPVALPDLASRLQALTLARVDAPDDALVSALLVKHFADRQMVVPPALIAYLGPRIERSFAAARHVVAQLDAASMARQRPVTVAMARALLDSPTGDA